MKLIDKDVLVSEIERYKKDIPTYNIWGDIAEKSSRFGQAEAYNRVLYLLSTLRVKEVDLENEIDDWYNTMGIPVTIDALKETARHFFELGIKMNQKGE